MTPGVSVMAVEFLTLPPDWLLRQIEATRREVAAWPESIRRMAGMASVPARNRRCKRCPPDTICCCAVSVDAAPAECLPCRLCNSKSEMYVEMPAYGDWDSGEFVMRIGCLCDLAMTPKADKWRTRLLSFTEAVAAWNAGQRGGWLLYA